MPASPRRQSAGGRLAGIRLRLRRDMGDAAADAWLRTPNALLGGASPSDLVLAGRAGRVESLVAQIENDAFT